MKELQRKSSFSLSPTSEYPNTENHTALFPEMKEELCFIKTEGFSSTGRRRLFSQSEFWQLEETFFGSKISLVSHSLIRSHYPRHQQLYETR